MRTELYVITTMLMTASAFAGSEVKSAETPSPGPRMHYEIRLDRTPIGPEARLEGACDQAEILADELKGAKISAAARSDFKVLKDLVCGTYHQIGVKPR